MKLTAYVMDGHTVNIRPAPLERRWMDQSPQRFAYRCLPLNIANTHGWEILCNSGFSAVWKGTDDKNCIDVFSDSSTPAPAISHFGQGVLTFHVSCLFRTEPGYDLIAMGPINQPKDAIAALTGVIETDWSPYTFTMNWKFTRPGVKVRFEKDEPFCHIYPVRRGELETIRPEIRLISEMPDLKAQHEAWAQSRREFNVDLHKPESQATADKWQKYYQQAALPDGKPAEVKGEEHRTRLRLEPFRSQK